MASYSWPSDFPDGCPPATATPANGLFYRIVKSATPQAEDFLAHHHSNPKLAAREIQRGHRTLCHTFGLSVYTDLILS